MCAQWVQQTSGTVEDIECLTVAPDGDLYAAGWGGICYSNDGGLSWSNWPMLDMLGNVIAVSVQGIHFVQPDEGVAVGYSALNNHNYVLRTTDGGLHWSEAYPSGIGSWPRGIYDVAFASSNVAFAVGESGRVLRSLNGGTSFSLLTTLPSSTALRVDFWDEQVGMLVDGNTGYIYRTTNGGAAWATVLAEPVSAIHAGPGTLGFAAGSGEFLTSVDNGATWSSQPAPFSQVGGIAVIDAQTIFVSCNDDGVFRTTDGGSSWETFMQPADSGLTDIVFASPTSGCAVGDDGKVITTTNAGGPAAPVAFIDAEVNELCGHTTLDLVAVGQPGWTYTWNLNGLFLGSTQVIALDYTASTGPLQFELTVAANGFNVQSSWSTSINVVPLPNVDVGPDLYLCSGNGCSISVSGADSYTYAPSAGLSSIQWPLVNFVGDTTSTYVITGTTGNCSNTDTLTIHVAPALNGDDWDTLFLANTYGTLISSWPSYHHGFQVTSLATMHRTIDAGSTWQQLAGPEGKVLEMVDPFVGYIAGDNYHVYRTNDGWDSYIECADLSHSTSLTDIEFLNRDTGYISQRIGNANSRFIRTTNGGESWDILAPNLSGYFRHFVVLSFDTLIAATIGAGLLMSADGGVTWYQPFPNSSSVAVSLNHDGTITATGSFGIARSYNRGVSWSVEDYPPGYSSIPRTMVFPDAQTGYGSVSTMSCAYFKSENGGSCWQEMPPPPVPCALGNDFHCPAPGATIMITWGGAMQGVYRTGALQGNYLGFVLEKSLLCSYDTVRTANVSFGHTTWAWYLDGSLVSTLRQPEFYSLAPGPHAIMLIGSGNGQADTSVHAFEVLPPLPVPIISEVGATCWNTPIQFAASGVQNGVHYIWQGGLGFYANSGTYPVDTIFPSHGLNANGWVVQVTDANGCISPWSDTAFVVPVAPPSAGAITGPAYVCTDSLGATVSTYSVQNVPGLVYNWSISPSTAGNIVGSGDTATVTWSSGHVDTNTQISLQLSDQCGTTSGGSFYTEVGPPNWIVTQPSDQYANLTESVVFSIVTAVPQVFCGTWFKDGTPLPGGCTSYGLTNITAADAGWYRWTGMTIGRCDTLVSDSAELVVNLNVATSGLALGTGSLLISTLGDGEVWYQSTMGPVSSCAVIDVLGRTVIVIDGINATEGTIDLVGAPAGEYFLLFSVGEAIIFRRTFVSP